MSRLIQFVKADAEARPSEVAYRFHNSHGIEEILTRAELWRRIVCASKQIRSFVSPGDRVLVAHAPGLDFNVSLLACMHAGAIAVPIYPPTLHQKMDRIHAVVRDCEPALAIGSDDAQSAWNEFLHIPYVSANGLTDPDTSVPDGETARQCEIALLQYTSGSTGDPKGVVITHGNLWSNIECIKERFQPSRSDRAVFWLPPYHDMGLVGAVLASIVHGVSTTLMSPATFLRRPFRWLELISRTSATISGAPNFGYELCTRRIMDAELDQLDLSSWNLAFCGAEPVDAGILRSFAARFSRSGFSERALYPCYGLAETTLIATGPTRSMGMKTRLVDASVLEEHRAAVEPVGSNRARELVACGSCCKDHELLIVDPQSCDIAGEGKVGEIWLRGPSVAAGYWQKPIATAEYFQATLKTSRTNAGYLRTGDLGFVDGHELYVVGRIKETINFAGRNLYPDDIERTARASHALLCDARVAAFEVSDKVVMVIEIDGRSAETDLVQLKQAVGRATFEVHGITPHHVSFVRRNSLPLTTSGKLRRNECRNRFSQGLLNEYA